MKRDMDLIRIILLALEEKESPIGFVDLDIPGHTPMEVAHHVLLLKDAGLIEAMNLTTMDGFDMKPQRLTWAGHEFLDAVKNDTVWNRTKVIVKEKGGAIPFEILKALVKKLAAEAFGL